MRHPSVHACVFVVDDNHDLAESLALLLEIDGYHVHTFFTGDSALEAAPGLHPAAGILDIDMPGMNGLELAKGMRAALPTALLVAYTARDGAADFERARTAGFDHYLVKPVPLAVIEDLLDKVCD